MASVTTQVVRRTPKSFLPWFALFIIPAGTYTYFCAAEEGHSIDRARARFRQAKAFNDARIAQGGAIVHEDELAARLPETYHGIGDVFLWNDKKRFGVDEVPRHRAGN